MNFIVFLFVLLSSAYADLHIAVLEFRQIDLQENSLALLLADDVRKGVIDSTQNRTSGGEAISVYTRENLLEILADQGKDGSACQGECEVEIARNIGAEYVVSGEIYLLNNEYVINLKLHETANGNVLGLIRFQSNSSKDLSDLALEKSKELILQYLTALDPLIQSEQYSDWNPSGVSRQLVEISTKPSGAIVMIDGKILCQSTPCKKEITAGSHKFHFDKERYFPIDQILNTEKKSSIHVDMEPIFGTITLKSNPEDVPFLLDKTKIKLPLKEHELDPGTHVISSDSPCYYAVEESIKIQSGEHIDKEIALTAKPSGIDVSTLDLSDTPVSADIYVDGKKRGQSPNVFKVDVCSRTIEARYKNYRVKQSLSLRVKETHKIDLKFEPAGFFERLSYEKPAIYTAIGSIVLLSATIPMRNAFYNSASEAEAQQLYDLNRATFVTGIVLAGGASALWVF
ncbi:MAG: PEGA domain-containing protein [Myxococcota bacterium]|nr:PEGA domain-containing protein [Myxococcota bacterium]